MNDVRVSSPYLPESVSGGTPAANERVRKVVRYLLGRLIRKKERKKEVLLNANLREILVIFTSFAILTVQVEFEKKRLQSRFVGP